MVKFGKKISATGRHKKNPNIKIKSFHTLHSHKYIMEKTFIHNIQSKSSWNKLKNKRIGHM